MNKGIFIAGTGTDIGKTFVTALLVKKLKEFGIHVGYYKAAISGANSISESDAGYVNQIAGIGQEESTLLSYLYKTAVSPHLAAKLEGNPVCMDKIKSDFALVSKAYEFVIMEGSGGIVCPIRYDETSHILLEDIIKELNLETLIVADAGLGTINAIVLTVEYLRQKNIAIRGIVLNRYEDNTMHIDNKEMIEELTGIPVLALVKKDAELLDISTAAVQKILGGNEYDTGR